MSNCVDDRSCTDIYPGCDHIQNHCFYLSLQASIGQITRKKQFWYFCSKSWNQIFFYSCEKRSVHIDWKITNKMKNKCCILKMITFLYYFFSNTTTRPIAQILASTSGALVIIFLIKYLLAIFTLNQINLMAIMVMGRIYEHLALKLTIWGRFVRLLCFCLILYSTRNAPDSIRLWWQSNIQSIHLPIH